MNYKRIEKSNINLGGKTLPQIGIGIHSHASLPNVGLDNSRISVLDQGAETLDDEDPYNRDYDTEVVPRASVRGNPYDMKFAVSQRHHASEEMLGGDADDTS
mgnify:CR=1 FL=1